MARLSAIKVFSALVAAGHADRCNTLRAALRDELLRRGSDGEIDAVTWHRGRSGDPAAYRALGRRVYRLVAPLIEDLPPHVLGPDGRSWHPRVVN